VSRLVFGKHLEQLLTLIQISTYPTDPSNPDACARMLTKAFDTSKKHHYQHMTRELLESISAYKSWSSKDDSSVLLLAGETNTNARAGRGYTHSWLSPATLFAVDILREKGARVVYYCCHPGVRTDDNDLDIHLAKDMLIKLAFQLLESQPKVLRRKMAQLQSIVAKSAWSILDTKKNGNQKYESYELRERQRAALSSWFSLLREILEALREEGCTYLIIDRLDFVEVRVSYFMDELVALVKNEGCLVKVMAVVDMVRGEWDEDLNVRDRRVLVVQGLDQKPAGTFGHTFGG
jgi:hypothetical protein